VCRKTNIKKKLDIVLHLHKSHLSCSLLCDLHWTKQPNKTKTKLFSPLGKVVCSPFIPKISCEEGETPKRKKNLKERYRE
jgi:hypothetical protein